MTIIYRYKGWFLGLVPVLIEGIEQESSVTPRHWSLDFPLIALEFIWRPIAFALRPVLGTPAGWAPMARVRPLSQPVVVTHEDEDDHVV